MNCSHIRKSLVVTSFVDLLSATKPILYQSTTVRVFVRGWWKLVWQTDRLTSSISWTVAAEFCKVFFQWNHGTACRSFYILGCVRFRSDNVSMAWAQKGCHWHACFMEQDADADTWLFFFSISFCSSCYGDARVVKKDPKVYPGLHSYCWCRFSNTRFNCMCTLQTCHVRMT